MEGRRASSSPPKKKIVFWIEKSVPDEYRAAVREGILEWNKAFEKIGFRDAIEVRQQEGEDFDPEDMNYNTFRWITTDSGFAMGPSRANPLTGEIIDADIIFDASMVRYLQARATALQTEQRHHGRARSARSRRRRLGLDRPAAGRPSSAAELERQGRGATIRTPTCAPGSRRSRRAVPVRSAQAVRAGPGRWRPWPPRRRPEARRQAAARS